MDIKRIIWILVAVMLIGFGVGFYSLIYNDDFKLSNLENLNIGNIDINSNSSNIKIGTDGIFVQDGDSNVIVSWDGIKVIDGDDKVIVGPDGIKVTGDKNKNDWNWNTGNWFNFGSRKLIDANVNEEKIEAITGVNTINVSSSFVDVKIYTEDRDDIKIKYTGKIKANVIPELETKLNGHELDIKLTTNNSNSYTVMESSAILEIIMPKSFEGAYSISGSSADIHVKNINTTDFKISTSSGDVSIANVKATKLELSSSSGEIYGQEIIGDVEGNSSSGDMSFILNDISGNYNLNSSSGDIEIKYTDAASYKGTINTSSGDVDYDGSIYISKDNKNNYEFTIGLGEKSMRINTSSGDIEFNNR